MSTVPVWPVYVGDLLSDVVSLRPEARGCYLTILLITWRRGGRPFEFRLGTEHERADVKELAFAIGVTAGRLVKKIWPKIAEYFDVSDGFLRNKRLESCLAEQRAKAELARENGRKGGRPKGSKSADPENPGVSENDLFAEPGTEPNPSPSQLSPKEGRKQRAAPRRPLPVDWRPEDELIGRAYAERKRAGLPEIDVERVALPKFVNHARARARTSADWAADFVNWCLNEQAPSHGGGVNGGKSAAYDGERLRAGLGHALARNLDPDNGATGGSRAGDSEGAGGARRAA